MLQCVQSAPREAVSTNKKVPEEPDGDHEYVGTSATIWHAGRAQAVAKDQALDGANRPEDEENRGKRHF